MNSIKDWRNDEQLVADLERMRARRLQREGRYSEIALIEKRRRYRQMQRDRIRRANVVFWLVMGAFAVAVSMLVWGAM